jgi:hypothetical protein
MATGTGHISGRRFNPLFSIVIPLVLLEAARKALNMPDAPVSAVVREALAQLAPPEVREQAQVRRGPARRRKAAA